MATWTDIADTLLEPGKPARSVDALALRDNPIAITEGASGAPRIQNGAFNNNTLGAEKFQSGATERNWVLARTSDASVGAIGTYAFLVRASGGVSNTGALSPGETIAGSDLNYGSVVDSSETTVEESGTPPGTWRTMGYVPALTAFTSQGSVFLRIA